jgi:hypothetical protein
MCVEADRVARNDHRLVAQRIGDLVDDILQHGKPQRQDDSIGSLQRVPVVDSDDRSLAIAPASVRADSFVGARELQGLSTGGELSGDGRAEPSSADDGGGHDRTPSASPR